MIREASINDIEDILEIGKAVTIDNSKIDDPQYASRIQLRGFIPEGFATEESFAEELEKSDVALIYEENNRALGFCTIRNEEYYPEDLEAVIWVDSKAKSSYYHGKHTTVVTYLLLNPESTQIGIGTQLFNEGVNRAEEKGFKDFFWITTLSPLANLASMAFITKQGFTRANFTMPSDLFGLKNQQSVLYWKHHN